MMTAENKKNLPSYDTKAPDQSKSCDFDISSATVNCAALALRAGGIHWLAFGVRDK